jgi:hypothetical protein
MKNRLLIAAGIVVIIIGAVFALQGFGVIEGSAMSNNHTFEVVGPLVALAGPLCAGRTRAAAPRIRGAVTALPAAMTRRFEPRAASMPSCLQSGSAGTSLSTRSSALASPWCRCATAPVTSTR